MALTRRETLKLMAFAALGATIPGCGPSDIERAAARVSKTMPLADREPTTLNRHEYDTVRVLADWIIPADDRSGSASDAGVPAFIDFILEETDGIEEPLKDGLKWLDDHSESTNGTTFIALETAQQRAILDRIAWPDNVEPGLERGAEFFTLMRDLTASGFWSSQLGVEDLGYMGNTANPGWEGCSHEAMAHLGLTYDEA
ncbi:MAG: gluconate 2-dehydrogenase subunit 3 family protein [Bacteroidetes bacterium]|nr:gluconate 2-dehydrogenase subunit 3 family protein [Bacteroidota bacterium]